MISASGFSRTRKMLQRSISRLVLIAIVSLIVSVGTMGTRVQAEEAGREPHTGIPHTGIEKGKVWLSSRYRYEHVNQAFFADPARASTLRLRPGLESGFFYGFRAGVEGDFIMEVGPDDFNNTFNGKTQYPVVVDVRSAEVNQAYIESHHIPGVVLLGGRYRKNLDNQRFIGSIPWRQNDQTFDGATATVTSIPGMTLFYGYVGNVNRIFSSRAPDGGLNDGDLTSNIHLFNVRSKPLPYELGTVVGYAYLLDIMDVDVKPGGIASDDFYSSASFGGFWKGKRDLFGGLTFNYYFEYARQTDYADQAVNYDAEYVHIAPGLSIFDVTATLGYEKLGSDDGVAAFQTPLATGHKFNGFADLFLVTPDAGLKDFYIDITYKVKDAPPALSFFNGFLVKAQYHEFRSDFGNIDYGHEFDLYVKQPICKGLFADFKYANYEAENFGTDREKFSFGLVYNY